MSADDAGRHAAITLGPEQPLGALAVSLLALVSAQKAKSSLVFVAQSGRRAEELVRLLRALRPELRLAHLPAWDTMPYDHARPSRAIMGRRAGALRWLTDKTAPPDIVVATPAAIIQRAPPQSVWAQTHMELRVGDAIDREAVEQKLERLGYTFDDRVDEPGAAAIRGRVIDLFPAAAPKPCRVEHQDGRVTEIRSYDPVSQRSEVATPMLVIDPASEFGLAAQDDESAPAPPDDASLDQCYAKLETLFDYAPDAPFALDGDAARRADDFFAQIKEAFEGRCEPGGRQPPAPERLYLSREEWTRETDARVVAVATASPDVTGVPRFARERGGPKLFDAFVAQQAKEGRRVVLCGASERDRRALGRRVARSLSVDATPAADWAAVIAAEPGAVLVMALPIEAGFVSSRDNVAFIAAADLLGSRAATPASAERPDAVALPIGEIEFRVGDAVVHLDHGMGVLEGLEAVGVAEAGGGEALRLRYANGAMRMTPVADIGKVWRYGSEADAVSLDRLDGDAWAKRRASVEAEIGRAAVRLVELARVRDETAAPKLAPPAREYERFASGFPYSLTPDQAAVAEAVLDDLASGRPMDRLVCGDVGFGKTEIALRAAAAAVFAGKQVAIIAPTTVLVRQHVRAFQKRFKPFGVEVAHLSRLVAPAEARKAKEGLASGALRIVVGTHALAAKTVRFHDLGLIVIDEEQRFGARDKAKLRTHAQGAHVLTLTATPIPRTMQSALVGLQDLSVIATPPVRRQPIRTQFSPFDPDLARDALRQERKRKGQSFVVCPRIEDIEPMAARLRALAPELSVLVAHGKMPADDMDDVMVRFADGEGDVLLATNIIESGLDVPGANTMLVWRPDRFGLAQLHQLRGRVGRGVRRGAAYLLTDAGETIAPATAKRLRTLESLDRLGAGFAISARDLDLRGAGDLLGDEQAGHVKVIGLGLYQHLLSQAIASARGASVEDWAPVIHLGLEGRIPEGYVPEPEMRVNLYARLDQLADVEDISAFEDEIDDRFGPPPDDVRRLFVLARLRSLCRQLGVSKLDGGPQAIAATPRAAPDADEIERMARHDVRWSGGRFISAKSAEDAMARARLATAFLQKLKR